MYCLDTDVLVGALVGESAGGGKGRKQTSEAFKQWIITDNPPLMLPTPVIAEFLTVSNSKREEALQIIRKNAEVHPFDGEAAIRAAELQKQWRKNNSWPSGMRKELVKADLMDWCNCY